MEAQSSFGIKQSFHLLIVLVAAYFALVLSISGLLNLLNSLAERASGSALTENEIRIALRVISSVLGPLLMMVATLLLLKRYFRSDGYRSLLTKFGFSPVGLNWQLVISFAVGVALILVVKELMYRFPPNTAVPNTQSSALSSADLWVQIVFAINVITIVPVAEEFVFRGVLYKGFTASCSKLVAAAAVSLLFTLAHIDVMRDGYWPNQIALISLPFVLVLAREISGSLYSPILIHAGFNFGSVFIV